MAGPREALYDASIRKWASLYTPDIPWYWIKAQIKAESAFNPTARSPVGAMGLGQFMPDTWADWSDRLGFPAGVSAFNPTYNIQATAAYMGNLRGQFKKPRPEYDRHSLAMASYNAGLGNILKAQKLADNTLRWKPTGIALCNVTGFHCKETNDYVDRIWGYIRDYESSN